MIDDIKNISNIVFFTVVTVITILSYLQARKTLFAPIRTETFKLQLKTFEEILLYFQNKSESDYLKAFDLDQIVSLNTLQMADGYILNFFPDKIKIDKDARSKTMSVLTGGIVRQEHMEKYFESADAENPVVNVSEQEKKIDNPAIVLAKWQRYEHPIIGFSQQYQDQMQELKRLASSPLLPKPLRECIGDFSKIDHENLLLVGSVVVDCAKHMPEHFLTAADMKKFNTSWVWNEFNHKRKHFEPAATEVLDYMNTYLKVEQIMK